MSKFTELFKEVYTVVKTVDTSKIIDGVQEIVDVLDSVNEANPTASRLGIDKALDGLRLGLSVVEAVASKAKTVVTAIGD